ncbi:hypothetical protein G6F46_014866 [Rhizopus delemar]|nr:hypothetical protein G6F46_014866 [Rhizopus delemar]
MARIAGCVAVRRQPAAPVPAAEAGPPAAGMGAGLRLAGRRQCSGQRHGALCRRRVRLGAAAVDHGAVGGVRDDADHFDALPAAARRAADAVRPAAGATGLPLCCARL